MDCQALRPRRQTHGGIGTPDSPKGPNLVNAGVIPLAHRGMVTARAFDTSPDVKGI